MTILPAGKLKAADAGMMKHQHFEQDTENAILGFTTFGMVSNRELGTLMWLVIKITVGVESRCALSGKTISFHFMTGQFLPDIKRVCPSTE